LKTKIFPLKNLIEEVPQSYDIENKDLNDSLGYLLYKIPTLSAYAIQSSELDGIPLYAEEASVGSYHEINGDLIKWFGASSMSLAIHGSQPYLRINYIGIKDYQNLFSFVEPADLRLRLAEMYEEAEESFENKLWLSYTIIAGAVCEGILLSVLNANKSAKFSRLIDKAASINISQSETLNKVREHRNIIHPGKYDKPNISRPVAMELKILIDELINVDWSEKSREGLLDA